MEERRALKVDHIRLELPNLSLQLVRRRPCAQIAGDLNTTRAVNPLAQAIRIREDAQLETAPARKKGGQVSRVVANPASPRRECGYPQDSRGTASYRFAVPRPICPVRPSFTKQESVQWHRRSWTCGIPVQRGPPRRLEPGCPFRERRHRSPRADRSPP